MKTITTLSTHTLDNVTGGAIRSSGSQALGYGGFGGLGSFGGLGGGGFPFHLFGKINNTLATAQQNQQAQQNQTMTCLALACAMKNR